MMENKKRLSQFIVFIAMVTIYSLSIFTKRAEAYEVNGFYQYEVREEGVIITKYTGGELTVEIPSKIAGKKVITIGSRAFQDNDIIEKVLIPTSVTTIDSAAFYDCDSLMEITIPKNVTTMNSGRWEWQTFGYCDNLSKVVIGDGLQEIQQETFIECPNLKSVTIGNKVTKIGSNAFALCKSLSNIELPNSVIEIQEKAFLECKGLKSVRLNKGLETIGGGAFFDCDGLTEITIPDSVIKMSSGQWGWQVFGYCDNLTTVVIGDGLKEIESQSFLECPKLQSVTLGQGLQTIGEKAFMSCASLTDIVIPSSVKTLGEKCFSDCKKLKTIDLPYGLDAIHSGAFFSCSSLSEVVIPNSVRTINSGNWGWQAFGECVSLTKIEIPNSVTTIGDLLLDYSEKAVIYGYAGSYAQKYAQERGILFNELTSIPSNTFSFDQREVLLMVGESKELTYTMGPSDTTDAIVWKTSDTNIATVDNLGKATGVNPGSVSIIATTTSGKKASITIIVQEAPKRIAFKVVSKTIALDEKYSQQAIIDDGTRSDVTITYKSSDASVATVSDSGKITLKKTGKATITAELFNGLKASYELTVKKAPNSVSLKSTSITMKVKENYTLKPVIPSDSYSSKYTFSSSNSSIVTVDSKGKLIAKKPGTATITIKTHNGKKVTCKVTVKK